MKKNKLIIGIFFLFLFATSLTYVESRTNVSSSNVLSSSVLQNRTIISNKQINFIAILKMKNSSGFNQYLEEVYNPASKNYHKFLNSSEIRKRFYPNKTEIEEVKKEFKKEGFKIESVNGLSVKVSARGDSLNSKFGTPMAYLKRGNSTYFGSLKQAQVPKSLYNKISSFESLNNFATIRPFIKVRKYYANGTAPFFPADIQKAYNYTSLYGEGINGTGIIVAIVDAYGDPTIRTDLSLFSNQYNLTSANLNVFYPCNSSVLPTDSSWSNETALDVEWVHAIAPSATIDLVITNNGVLGCDLYDGVSYVVNNLSNVGVMSLSWGSNEIDSSSAFLSNISNNYFQVAAARGISVFVSSGDCGAFYRTSSGCNSTLSTSFPASSPYVTAVGGTTLNLSSSGNYDNETAWTFSGGGVSNVFSKPSWQIGNGVPSDAKRDVPDVSLDADPNSGVVIITNSIFWIAGGTSLSAPLWAGTAALINQKINNKTGSMNPTIYQLANSTDYSKDFHDITSGNNGNYFTNNGYDLVTGVGTPIAYNFVNDFTSFYFPPLVKIFSPIDKIYNKTNLTLNYTATDINLDKVWFNYNGTNTSLTGNTTFIALDNQNSTLTLYANDTAGNLNSTDVTFTIDTIFPLVKIFSPIQTSYYNSINLTLNYTATDINLDKVWFNYNGTNKTLTGNTTFSVLNNQTSILTLYANDTVGNLNSTNVSFKIISLETILTAPLNNSILLKNNATFDCNSSSGISLVNITFNLWNSSGDLINSTFKNISGTNNFTETTFNNLIYGNYSWGCSVKDSSGNSFFSTNFSLKRRYFFINLTSPKNNSFTNKEEINFSCKTNATNNLTNVTFNLWNSSGDLINFTSKNITGNFNSTNLSYNLSNFSEEKYFWNCKAEDNLGNSSFFENNYTFISDKTKPKVILISPANSFSKTGNSENISFQFNATDNTNLSSCSLILDKKFFENKSTSDATLNSSFFKVLTPGTYNWTISCSDKAGNINNLTYRILKINSPPVLHSGGGGGGGGSSGGAPAVIEKPLIIPKNITLSEEDLKTEYTQILIGKEILKFRINNQTNHTIKIDSIKNSSVTLEIHSNKTLVTLKVGESKKLNLSSKDYYDLYIKLNSIINKSVNLTLKEIREPIKIKVSPSETKTTNTKTQFFIKNYKLFSFIVAFIILIIFIRFFLKNKKVKDGKTKKMKKVIKT